MLGARRKSRQGQELYEGERNARGRACCWNTRRFGSDDNLAPTVSTRHCELQ